MLPRGCTKTKGCSNHRNPNAPTLTPRIPLRHPQICPLSTFGGRNQRFWLPPPHPWWEQQVGKATAGPLRGHVPMTCPVLRGAVLKSIFSCLIRRLRSQQTEAWQRTDLIFHPPGAPHMRVHGCAHTCATRPGGSREPEQLLFIFPFDAIFFLSFCLESSISSCSFHAEKGFCHPARHRGDKNFAPRFRARPEELSGTRDALAGSGPTENRWKAPRTNSPAAEGEQHVTATRRHTQLGKTPAQRRCPAPNHRCSKEPRGGCLGKGFAVLRAAGGIWSVFCLGFWMPVPSPCSACDK